jgi:hypothetical protein
MKYEYYKELSISNEFETYDFISTGIKGNISKRVTFEFVEDPVIYNLAFGDLTEEGAIDDYCISDNKDMTKILATIVAIGKLFLEKYPERIIIFRGSTIERTRLYPMAIGNNLDELLKMFCIYGVTEDGNVDFFAKNYEYVAFMAGKKL